MTKNIFKVYNQKEFLDLMRKKIKKNDIIIFDERGKNIYDSKSLWALEMAKLINREFLKIKRRKTGGLLSSKKEENLIAVKSQSNPLDLTLESSSRVLRRV